MKYKKVFITDLSDYDPDRCSNGGKYAFFAIYVSRDDNSGYDVRYGTSADMLFCPACGGFGHVYDPDAKHNDCDGPQVITEDEMNQILLKSNKESDNIEITIDK